MSDDARQYPEGHSGVVETWGHDGLTFTVLHVDRSYVDGGHYCGYVRFPKRPLREQGYGGIATYVPVHGGITFAKPFDDGSFVYGFDCAHAGDDSDDHDYDPKVRDIAWLKAECERLAVGIVTAKKYERRYLRNITQAGKAKAIDEYHDEMRALGAEFSLQDNFGAMIGVLCGQL